MVYTRELLYVLSIKLAYTQLGVKWAQKRALKSLFGLKSRFFLHYTVSSNFMYSYVEIYDRSACMIGVSTKYVHFCLQDLPAPLSQPYSPFCISTDYMYTYRLQVGQTFYFTSMQSQANVFSVQSVLLLAVVTPNVQTQS